MILQIHESIGHPLELDRILGDERNYAGSSFVSPDMFGEYQYGSKELNVTFNPTLEGELLLVVLMMTEHSQKKYLIKEGKLLDRSEDFSSQRLVWICCMFRATNWNRPPIDRMGK